MRFIKVFTLLIILLFSLNAASAADVTKAYQWMVQQPYDNVFDTSLVVLASKYVSTSNLDAIGWINSKKAAQGYLPAERGTIKDTAMALIALNEEGKDVTDILSWLEGQQSVNMHGDYFIQIETTDTGTCSVSYTKDEQLKEEEINVDNGKISSSSCPTPDTLFDIDTCFEPGLISNNPSIVLNVDCTLAEGRISAVYKEGNDYFLIGEVSSAPRAKIRINNGYFGDYESTLYANWALYEAGSEIDSLLWLKKEYNPSDVVHNALLYISTEESYYLNKLLELQDAARGDFGNVHSTALAVLALSRSGQYGADIELAKDWLEGQQSDDGSWNQNVKDTAMVLYGAYSTERVTLQTCAKQGGYTCKSNEECSEPWLAASDTSMCCPVGCSVVEEEVPVGAEVCLVNGDCETAFGENAANCPDDCYCGDGICDNSEDASTCPADCGVLEEECGNDIKEGNEECDGTDDSACPGRCQANCTCEAKKRGGLWWLLLIIILLVGLGYFYYTRFYKKRKKKPPVRPEIRVPERKVVPREYKPYAPPRKTKVEEELEKSLEEAKKLLKK